MSGRSSGLGKTNRCMIQEIFVSFVERELTFRGYKAFQNLLRSVCSNKMLSRECCSIYHRSDARLA